jgi:hypothetical protein
MTNMYTKLLRGAAKGMPVEKRSRTAKRILRGHILRVCAVALLLFGWGTPPAVVAQDQDSADAQSVEPHHATAADFLGVGSTTVDGWRIVCPFGTHHVHFDVSDLSAAGPTLGILATDVGTGLAAIRLAPQGGLSAAGQVNEGSGEYRLYIFKAGGATVSSASYNSLQVCHTAGHGFLNHTAHTLFQNLGLGVEQ